MQLAIGAPDEAGRRTLTLYSRSEQAPDAAWTRHAGGMLAPSHAQALSFDLRTWPPPDAVAVSTDGLYEALASAGLRYGPDFRGLRAVWKRGDELFAEAQLPEAMANDASRFALHPALLDAALHALATDADRDSAISLPFSFGGISLRSVGATTLRVRLHRPRGESVSLAIADATGEPIAAIESLALRPASAEQLQSASDPHRDALLRVAWTESPHAPTDPVLAQGALLGSDDTLDALTPSLERGLSFERYPDLTALQHALDQGAGAPGWVVVYPPAASASDADSASAAHAATARWLALLQAWVADDRLASCRLLLLTRRAVATESNEDVLHLDHAPLWGLGRCAPNEYPDLPLFLLDIDDSQISWQSLAATLGADDKQLALREGRRLVPRLARLSQPSAPTARPINPQGTVLVTGATGTLGTLIARHLVAHHGVRHLLLASRQGPDAPGAESLCAELRAAGASVTLARCDVADARALQTLLHDLPTDHPLAAVVHAAGTLDDGLLADMTAERIDRVFAPKLDAAWHLHRLTAHLDLDAFVLFSSLAGTLGSPGQANYAAANTFLDALAHHRRAQGLAASSLAWGYWAQASGMTAHLSAADTARIKRVGVRPLSADQGLALFDAALQRATEPALVAAHLDLAALARLDTPHPLFASLVRTRSARPLAANSPSASSFAQRLLSLSTSDRERTLLDLVRAEAASVLGIASPGALDPHRPFQELGLDSLMALELRNKLAIATGMRLQATLLFDHPTPQALARFFTAKLLGTSAQSTAARSGVPSTDTPIAIVAMSCRFPGSVRTPEDLWALLAEGRDAISHFPDTRGWDVESLYDPDPEAPGKSYTREGGFLYDADYFDPAFFGISPREALAIDPQQRLLLETSWETFERAGIDPNALQASQTGVFVGVMYSDYGARLAQTPGEHEAHIATGSSASVASGRIAYTFGLQGPAVTVDTACSSSLVAIHLACQALRHGECSLALAGGVAVMATPVSFTAFSRQRGLAPDGRCKSFSARADGAGWGEGTGMLLLERLPDALKLGHPVLAVLRGSAVNQDGKSQGLTAPNGPAQERVIRLALDNARLTAKDIDAVEAHGTGTTLGDPIEAHALLATYGEAHSSDRPLWLGSLKSNIGHTQAAAGVGSVIKMVLALQHAVLPKTLHAESPSSHIDWSSAAVQLLHHQVPWTPSEHPRRAGISSFGISGTNAHVILEEAPAAAPSAEARASASLLPAWPVLLSAKTEPALRAQAERLRDHLIAHDTLSLADVAYSLPTSRSHFEYRAALVARNRDQLLADLLALASGQPTPPLATLARSAGEGKVVFVFPGQGSQWQGMGLSLMESSAVFRTQFDACEQALAPFIDWSLLSVLRGEQGSSWLDRVDVVQPVLFAVMVSLAALWRSLGVEPDAVVGHSQGEIAAAFVAGALSLDDAAKIVALRSRALTAVSGNGAMAAVELGIDTLQIHLAPWANRISIAAINSPHATLISGDPDAVEALISALSVAQIFARKIRVDYASHCAQMEMVRDDLLRELASIAPRHCTLPLYSTVTGSPVDGSELDATYWYRNLRQTVRFADATAQLVADGYRFFVEVSAHPVLALALHETLEHSAPDATVVSSLRRDDGDFARLLLSVAELHVRGRHFDWPAFFAPFHLRRVSLPTYPFQRERFWLDAPKDRKADVASAGLTSADHPLLGAAVSLADSDGLLFTGRLSLAEHPWLAGHALFDSVILPATAFVELTLLAAHRAGVDGIEELTVHTPLTLPTQGAVLVQLAIGAPDEAGRRTLTLYSRSEQAPDAAWTRHAGGMLAPSHAQALSFDLRTWPPPDAVAVSTDGLYEALASAGLRYGPDFRGLRAVWKRGDELFAEAQLPEAMANDASRFALHPALLDAALHALATDADRDSAISLPFSFGGISLRSVGATTLRVRLHRPRGESLSLAIADATGEPIAAIESLALRPLPPSSCRALPTPIAMHSFGSPGPNRRTRRPTPSWPKVRCLAPTTRSMP